MYVCVRMCVYACVCVCVFKFYSLLKFRTNVFIALLKNLWS